jgi:hypothetical protein
VKQDHNIRETENSVTHIDREAQSLVLADFSDRSTRMMELSVTLVFWSCVTLGFFNKAFYFLTFHVHSANKKTLIKNYAAPAGKIMQRFVAPAPQRLFESSAISENN